ncbi:NAD(P)-binding protein [Xylaria castorea]|nr:NAD(P)-binding protein [Xylaria castorea]
MPGSYHLAGNALVTGGGSGIGRAVCVAFARCGIQGLSVADINMQAAIDTVAECRSVATCAQSRHEPIQIDVALPDSVQNAVSVTVKALGRIDYCVHAAGITGEPANIIESPLESFRRTLDINVQGTFLVLKTVATAMASQEPKMIDSSQPARGICRGSIVTLGSVFSTWTCPNAIQYNASKHAVLGLTRSAGKLMLGDLMDHVS